MVQMMRRGSDDSSDSDDNDLVSPSRIRPTFRRETMTSPMVTAAARRQLRGGKSEKKSAAEIAADYRKKMQEGEVEYEQQRTGPPTGMGAQPVGDISLQINDSAIVSPVSYQPDHSGHQYQTRLVSVVRKTVVGYAAISGGSVGIGVKFYPNKIGDHIITSLLPGGPAENTGLISTGDVIVAVDGILVRGRTSEEVKMLIIGQESTSVELLLRKASVTSPPPTFIVGSPPGLPRQFCGQYTGDLPASVEPMSTYSPSLYCSLPESVRAGIGIRFGIDRNSNVSIIDLMPGSPAEECRQIRPGDRLLSVDGMAVMGMQAPQIEHIISGPQGSQVILHVEGMQDSARRTVALTRRVHTSSPQLLFPNVASISPMPPLQVSVIPPTPNIHDPHAFLPHSSLASASPGAQQKAAEQRPVPPSPHQLGPFQGVQMQTAEPAQQQYAEAASPKAPNTEIYRRFDIFERTTREKMDGLESIVRMQSESLARQEQLLRKLQEKQDAQMRQMELKQSELCTCVIS